MLGRFAPGASAPDLIGSRTVLAPGGRSRRGPAAPYRYVHLEVDLRHESWDRGRLSFLQPLEGLLREREVIESADLLRLVAATLHATTSLGYTRVDHWEVAPGGWLPLPEATHRGSIEPTGHLLRALEDPAWAPVARARSFSVRLSGTGPNRIDLTVRRVHRERRHSLSLDLWGSFRRPDLHRLAAALRGRLPVLRIQVTRYAHEAAKATPGRARRGQPSSGP